MIVVEKLNKSFNGTNVLTDISTQFEKGKTNLIIGQSGSGKTVLLKCILGLYGIDSGNIYFENRSLQKMDTKERSVLRQEMGMVFQGSALFDSMTVEENIMFPMRMLTQKSPEEMLSRANEVINRVNLINAN
ncbi:MAG: ATP-binding cassette domain-containing protein, partial [Flavobacteriaceae bacterium]